MIFLIKIYLKKNHFTFFCYETRTISGILNWKLLQEHWNTTSKTEYKFLNIKKLSLHVRHHKPLQMSFTEFSIGLQNPRVFLKKAQIDDM